MISRILIAALLVVAVSAAGCKDRSARPDAGRGAPAAIGGAQRVRFEAAGGVTLAGWLYGRPAANGVVLVPDAGHGYEAWDAPAQELAASGFRVLTIEFPDGGAPGGPAAVVRAAAAYLRARGAEKVALIGEGAGGAAALAAAVEARVGGVAAVSAPAVYRGPLGGADAVTAMAWLDAPVLLMAALADTEAALAARRLYDAAGEPRTLALVPGTARGAEILRGAEAAPARGALRDFLREAFADRTA